MTDDRMVNKLTSGLELELGNENKRKIDQLLNEISRLNHIEKLLLYLKLPGETSLFKSLHRQDARADSISIQWIKTHLEPDPNFSLLKKNVYENYKSFCSSNKHPCVSLSDFGKNLCSTMKTVHHRRLGKRGEALYAYAGVNYLEEAKSFLSPDLSKQFSKSNANWGSDGDWVDSDQEEEIENNSDKDDDEVCDLWEGRVSSAVRSLVLEWAEKVIDKNIKFKKYRQLAEHLFNQNFINTHSKDAYILLSHMRQSGTNKIILPKVFTSPNNASNSDSMKLEHCQVMQNQTKQKLFNTLTKRDELRQQKMRAKQEEFDQEVEINDLHFPKANNKVRSFSSSSESSTSKAIAVVSRLNNVNVKMNSGTTALKRPSSAHQKVILPKIVKMNPSTPKQSSGPDPSNNLSRNQFLLLHPRATIQSTVAPMVIALVSHQSPLTRQQTFPLQIQQVQPHQNPNDIGKMMDDSAQQFTNQIVQNHNDSFLPISDQLLLKVNKVSDNRTSSISTGNLSAPDVVNKVYEESQFIASVLNNAANNPFGSASSCALNSFDGDEARTSRNLFHSDSIKIKGTSTIKNKFSNQTVSMLLNRQRMLGQKPLTSLNRVRLVTDKRPVAKILQDKREKVMENAKLSSSTFQDTSKRVLFSQEQVKPMSQLDIFNNHAQSSNQSIQCDLILSLPNDHIEDVDNSKCSRKAAICYLSEISADEGESVTVSEKVPICSGSLDIKISEIVNCNPSSHKVHSNKTLMDHGKTCEMPPIVSRSEKVMNSQLLQLLNEPIIHPDGSVVFQKNCNPSEILSWFESQESKSISNKGLSCSQNATKNGIKKCEKVLSANPSLVSLNNNLCELTESVTLCSPSSFLTDKGYDDSLMPYSNNFAQNFTLQQLSEALKSRSGKLGTLSSFLSPKFGTLSPLFSRQQESRPASAMVGTNFYESFKSCACLSRPSTVASAIADVSEKLCDGRSRLKSDRTCFTPIQMIEKITPGISVVRHPQPLVPTNNKLSNNSFEMPKLYDFQWNGFVSSDHSSTTSMGSFVPYNGMPPTELPVTNKMALQKEVDTLLMSDESLFMYFSNERQRHSSAQEIAPGTHSDQWIFNGVSLKDQRTEAEIDAILQQGFNESMSASTPSGQISLRCHSEPAKYRIPSMLSPDNDILMVNVCDKIVKQRDDKADQLQEKGRNLADINSNNDLGMFFEDEDGVNFNLWNASGGIRDHLISGMSPPKLILSKIQESNEYLVSDKELEFLVSGVNGPKMVDAGILNEVTEEHI